MASICVFRVAFWNHKSKERTLWSPRRSWPRGVGVHSLLHCLPGWLLYVSPGVDGMISVDIFSRRRRREIKPPFSHSSKIAEWDGSPRNAIVPSPPRSPFRVGPRNKRTGRGVSMRRNRAIFGRRRRCGGRKRERNRFCGGRFFQKTRVRQAI